ncbi:hypothetical protein [Sphingobacterium luzhongxinii]|uniref:hypothetical protein n=1 Tax=Sphingobacterium luzhongxinii TaxID=2654181 RepID=UPI0013D90522|nr:hypothetical protein [Sphingobacterium sp. xlx-183]
MRIFRLGANYKIIVYVQEANPGDADDHFEAFGNGVGHAAIGLTKIGSNGQSVIQVVGFYPEGANIFKEFSGPSKLVDNGNLSKPLQYTVKMELNIGNEGNKFRQVRDYIKIPPASYPAFDNNCVKFVKDACAAGGITVPFEMKSVVILNISPSPAPPDYVVIDAYTPAGLAGPMRQLMSAGDTRISRANNQSVPNSHGPLLKKEKIYEISM